MNIKFRTLFTITLLHSYYQKGLCKDFDFVIPIDTQQWLNNGRLITKVREGKLYVLFEAVEDNMPLVSITGQTLRFGLKLKNPFFSHFTKLPPHSEGTFLYKVTVTNPRYLASSSEKLEMTSPDSELQRQSIFSIIEIAVDDNVYTTASAFEIAFEAKEEILKYYVVAKNFRNEEFAQLRISDPSGIEFSKELTNDKLLGPIVLFSKKVTRQEKIHTKIQLYKNGEVLIAHLPQPSASQANANLIIHLSKP